MAAPNHDRGDQDTIVAIITPPGEGGIAALRLAGPHSFALAHQRITTAENEPVTLEPFHLHYGFFRDANGTIVDEITAVHMPHGHSYTGLDQIEIFCHGGRLVVRTILDALIAAGARPAEPGEFTKLAFLNGRIDLAKAEAVAEIIRANSHASLEASREHLLGAYSREIGSLREQLVTLTAEIESSIDFAEEEITPAENDQLAATLDDIIRRLGELIDTYKGGQIISEGFKVAIGGRPNAGKSSLFNLLLKRERALVNPTPGTTRDYLSEWVELDGFAVNLIDTAGIRRAGGQVERLGMARAREIIAHSHLLLWMVDLSNARWSTNLSYDLRSLAAPQMLIVGNKVDLVGPEARAAARAHENIVPLSCLTGAGLSEMTARLVKRIRAAMPDLTSGVVVTSARHKQKLAVALKHAKQARLRVRRQESPEIVSFFLRQATNALDEITGRVYTEEILGRIFGKFCIGK